MRLFRRRSPTADLDPQLTGLRFDAHASGPEEESGKPHEQQQPLPDYISYDGVTPKSARKLGPSGGLCFGSKRLFQGW
jgi:hypothetical protein